MEKFLYDELLMQFGKRTVDRTEVPSAIEDNLNPKFEIRPYQKEAFQRFLVFYQEEEFRNKLGAFHLLYNMATGSGKTLIMAGLILYLYEQGYRNFIFFVHSTNIIEKTKDNFLNVASSKYLFNEKIVIKNKEVFIKTIENLDEADEQNINIKFTTVQKLHGDLENPKEDSVTYEDFEGQKVVLLGDEAHHLSSGTKSKKGNLFGTWEETVLKILKSNGANILLEFTATLDYDSREITEKYKDKVLFKYDLKHFREDKYSKEINIVRSYYDETERILQALILNQYRQELAIKHGINLKPVILFKAKRTITESEQNKTNFHQLIDNLDVEQITKIKETSTVEVVQRAFRFFESNEIRLENITERIKNNFREEFCISANNDAEAERNQMILNSLEDEDNPVRAVFAVQKLNEGWDVLNLFDIVRLYEERDGKAGKLGKTTIAEAQLIGRGARYFPFKLDETQDKYKRKYDAVISTDINNLKILEELFYHTKEDSRYIAEIKQALVESGAMEDDRNLEKVEIKIKEEFKETDLYQNGLIFINERKKRDNKTVHSILDMNVPLRNVVFQMSSGNGSLINAFTNKTELVSVVSGAKDVKVIDFPLHIVRFALAKNPFYYFNNLQKRFPNVTSIRDFITNENYLGGLSVTFRGTAQQVLNITSQNYLEAITLLLNEIQEEIKGNTTQYQGTAFKPFKINTVFVDKSLHVKKGSEKEDGQKAFVGNKDWYAFDANYGTSEEKAFVEMFERRFDDLQKQYDDIYILRNERFFAIFDKNGQRFEPDFVLYATQKNKKEPITYQVFIEPKGSHLIGHDKWKANFLEDLRTKKEIIQFNTDKYLITGLPFYNVSRENDFVKELETTLEIIS